MNISKTVRCEDFPCSDVRHECFNLPNLEVDPQSIKVVLISEAAPAEPKDFYYSGDEALFAQTTVLAFNDAGIPVKNIAEILARGVYLTTAVKCGKTGYGVATQTVNTCSRLLEQELAVFPNVKAFLLMGDVAIQAVNAIARRRGEKRVIPAGSTYKIRGGEFYFRGARAFPSYLQAGPSFFIEKSKRRMIAEDIASAIRAAEGELDFEA